MPDKYSSYAELKDDVSLAEGQDYHVLFRRGALIPHVGIIAIHGGNIEPASTEIAAAIASHDCSFASFIGARPTGNRVLHITSTRFDEPRILKVVQSCVCVVSVHGYDDREDMDNAGTVLVGGRDEALAASIIAALVEKGFAARHARDTMFPGTDPENVCNKCTTGCGVQLEVPKSLRLTFFDLGDLSPKGRRRPTASLFAFANGVRAALGLPDVRTVKM